MSDSDGRRDRFARERDTNKRRRSPSPARGGYGGGGGARRDHRNRTYDDRRKRGRRDADRGGSRRRGGGSTGGSLRKQTYKEFMEHQDDDITPEEGAKRYKEYCTTMEKKLMDFFFERHSTEAWFREKYHPESRMESQTVLDSNRRALAGLFAKHLEAGFFDGINLDHPVDINEPDSMEMVKRMSATFPYTLFVPHMCDAATSHKELAESLSDHAGVLVTALSPPSSTRSYDRDGWVIMESADDTLAMLALSQERDIKHRFEIAVEKRMVYKGTKDTPRWAASMERLEKDAGQAFALIGVLDAEVDVECPLEAPPSGAEEAEVKRLLDLAIAYLRRVHGFCYYCGEQFASHEELSIVCGSCHYRGMDGVPRTVGDDSDGDEGDDDGEVDDDDGGASGDAAASKKKKKGKMSKSKSGSLAPPSEQDIAWFEALDGRIAKRLAGDHPRPATEVSDDHVEAARKQLLEGAVLQEEEERFRCCAVDDCSKLFRGRPFLEKHIGKQHGEIFDKAPQVAADSLFRNNYESDPRRPMPTRDDERGGRNGRNGGGGGGGGRGGRKPSPRDRRRSYHGGEGVIPSPSSLAPPPYAASVPTVPVSSVSRGVTVEYHDLDSSADIAPMMMRRK